MTIRIVLVAQEKTLLGAFEAYCSELDNVVINHGSILDIDCDAVVSPANSFGFMDGGIDALYVDRFGSKVQDRLRLKILRHHHGELLVGDAEIVETDNARIPYIIAAPTMRVPMALGPETINPYLATRAALLLARQATNVTTLAFPGMGTGVGRVPADVAARQISIAIRRHATASKARLPSSWAEASEDHQRLYTDQPVRLQH